MRCAVLALILGACAAPSGGAPSAEGESVRADRALLDVPTRLLARSARLVLAAHWRPETKLEAIHVDRGDGSVWTAEGGVKLSLRGLQAEIDDRVTITFLDDHEHFVLYATDVELIERRAGYVHRHRNLHALTIADDKLSLFSR